LHPVCHWYGRPLRMMVPWGCVSPHDDVYVVGFP
jgi:hypothetical protein